MLNEIVGREAVWLASSTPVQIVGSAKRVARRASPKVVDGETKYGSSFNAYDLDDLVRCTADTRRYLLDPMKADHKEDRPRGLGL